MACAIVLSGCAQPVALPPGPSPDEVVHMQEQIARVWWEVMLPGEPMPEIRVVGYTAPETRDAVVADCMQARRPQGATYSIQSTANGFTMTGGFPADELHRSMLVCSAQHPIDPAGDHGLLSYEQLEYAYAWLSERSVPCLEAARLPGRRRPGLGAIRAARSGHRELEPVREHRARPRRSGEGGLRGLPSSCGRQQLGTLIRRVRD